MTTKLIKARVLDKILLPDPRPCDLDVSTYYHVNYPAYPAALANHFGITDTMIISSEMAASLRPTEKYEDVRFPDLLVAFDVDRPTHQARNGYVIEEQGKPPDFVLEVASPSNARNDETIKRDYYARIGVPEYWRFDETGGRLYRSGLEGDTLLDGRYQPIPINRTAEDRPWGHSAVLGLDLCWEAGILRWWDPVGQRYLVTYDEMVRHLSAADARAAAADASSSAADARAVGADARAAAANARAAAADARAAASEASSSSANARAAASEARSRELEAELRRRDQP